MTLRPSVTDAERLLKLARAARLQGRPVTAPIEPVERGGALALSFAQQRLWFLEQLGGLGDTYHIPTRLRLGGALDRVALRRALDAILARHEALRTTFVAVEGEPVQRIAPAEESPFRLAEHDLRGHAEPWAELRRLAAEEAGAPFDLEQGPLIRGRMVTLANDEHVLLLTMHHIVSDGWSMEVLTRELVTLYDAFRRGEPDPLPPLPLQYADYAAWQRKWVAGEVLRQQADYWKETLSGAPGLLELPTDHPRPPRQSHAGAVLELELDQELTAGLKALGRRHGTTLFITVLAGWAAVLGRLSGQHDVVVGTTSANRGRAEIEGLIGFFVNTLAVRVDLSGSPTVAELLARVRARSVGAQQNQDIPFEQVVELVQPARSLAHTPLFQVMFSWLDTRSELPAPRQGGAGPGAGAASEAAVKFDLSLSLAEAGGRIAGTLTWATALFEQATVERYVGYLRRVLAGMAADAGGQVERLQLLSADERREVTEAWNATGVAYPRDACVHELFEAQVEKTPDSVALAFEGESLTCAELNARANRLAHHLRALGVGPDVRVGLCVERSLEMMVGLLGVLKAGGAYVALDPEYPVERLRYMLADSAPAVVLTRGPSSERLGGLDVPVVALDRDAARWADRPATNPDRAGLTAGHLAYLIYTSGSTGRPKGVMVEHRSVANVLAWMRDAWPLDGHDVVLQKTPYSFDASLRELIPPLLAGARMVVARPGGHRDAEYMLETIRREAVTTLHFVPSMLQVLVQDAALAACTSVERVVCGGEPMPPELVRDFYRRLPRAGLYNVYGPTEAAVDVTAWSCSDAQARERIPIGRPMANTRAYVLDAAGEPVPAGVVGELYLGGVQVARGYLGRAELTAERFVADPFGEPGARLYRTGDLARWVGDGALEVLGRADAQVKVRGFRIELGEIEARLKEHPGVREAAVLAREDEPGNRRLVAYYAVDGAADADALRAHLAQGLPEHMVPAAYVELEALPRTPNGKLDRNALPAPEGDAFARRGYEAPESGSEAALAEIWSEVLGVERIGRRDSFFELGGHSLLAVRVISRVRQVLGAEVGIADLFERPVLADLARTLANAVRTELPPIERVDRGGRLPLSFAQQRLWFLEQLGGLGDAYHVARQLRLAGELDRDALLRALDRVLARHEALRTTFVEVGGEPVQRIAAESRLHLVEHDLGGHPGAVAELGRLAAEEARAPFDLEHGPLIRGRLIRLAADDHVLLITMHHIVSDGWSSGVLTRELGALYGAFRRGEPDPLPALPVQYADYAAWQRKWVDGEVLQEQAEYWKETLGDAPALLELPLDHPRPARQDHAGAWLTLELDGEAADGLASLSRRHGTTLFMTVLAGWAAVLARLSGQDDVVVGTPSANRGRAEIEGLIGFFVNTLALRVDLSGSPSVSDLLGRVRERALQAQQHQDIPFEQVVELVQPARSLSHSPLFQVMFTWQNAPESRLELPGLALAPLPPVGAAGAEAGAETASSATAKFDLALFFFERGGRIAGGVTYATSLFEQATVERHLAYLRRVLEAMAADDLQPVDALPLLPQAERRLVVEEWNATDAAYPSELCVHELFESQARRTPGAIAVVHDGEELTYAELNARANRVAHHLRARGVGPEARVAVLVPRSIELVVAELAILKAGAAYVPVDPSFPAGRIAFMAADSGARIVLGRSGDVLPEIAGVERVDVDVLPEGPSHDLRVPLESEAAAYVMYTSGSTGEPKGVVVPHRAIPRLVINNGYADFRADDRVAFAANPAFDASTMEVWAPLLNGGRIVVIAREVLLDPGALARTLAEAGVTAMFVTTAVFNQYAAAIPAALAGLRFLLTGGENADPSSFARVLREGGTGSLIHCYGPTETTTYAITHLVTHVAEGARGVPLGRPISNTRIYILDRTGQPVPVGVAGEMYIGGAGVALGYLNRPELTTQRFVADPFGGGRMYRTGDLGRWLPDGTIEFLGRNDFQVKVRGFRIELGEIEARLAEHEDVREAVVLAREDAPGDRRLVAYIVAPDSVAADALRAHLSERLPEHMVPAAFVRLERLPLTPTGKVDRKALPAPEGDAFVTRSYEAPVGKTEEALAEVWSELLRVEQVGRHDHFFELGGHSLLAVRVISRVRQVLGVEVSLAELFSSPVLAELARAIESAARTELPPIERVDRGARLPLSFAQQRLWFLEQMGDLGGTYHISNPLRLRGELDRAALVRALDRLVERHESLRTTFSVQGDEPEQRIAPDTTRFHLLEHDLSGEAQDALERVMAEEAAAPFDLEQGPLIRGSLIRLAADDHVLLLTMHHIVTDGWSMGVLADELGRLYGAFRAGQDDPLPPLPIQYADYAAWQRRWLNGDVLREQAEYWKRTLSGAPELLELPTDHPRPARPDYAGAPVGVDLGEELSARLKALSSRHGATLHMTLLAGWAAVLARLSGQDDVVVGTPTANRGRSEIEGLIGFFVNTLALRIELGGSPSVSELLARVKARALEAQANQDIPFEQVVELAQPVRSLAHTPLFQVMFTWQNASEGRLELPGLRLGGVDVGVGAASQAAASQGAAPQAAARFDLSLTLGEAGGRIVGSVVYATALFGRATVERFVGYLRRALEEMAEDETRPVDRLALMAADERAQVVEGWNRTEAGFPDEACFHELFEAQVERTPTGTAVVFEGEELTYAELNARANRLAHHLRDLGVGPDARVAVCMERGPEMVAGLLAVLKAGGAYVPLDPAYPAGRLRQMLEDCAPVAVLTDGSPLPALDGSAPAVVDLSAPAWAHRPATNPPHGGVKPHHLAYLIYTSGSTGTPKGVMVEHRSLVNHTAWQVAEFGIGAGDTVLQRTSISFDASVWELWTTLASGARMLLLSSAAAKDPATIAQTIEQGGVTIAQFVPTLLQVVLGALPPGGSLPCRILFCGGEPLSAALVNEARSAGVGEVVNLYGPTEATIDSTWHVCGPDGRAPSIGLPIANARVYVLDVRGEPVPVGVAGELCVGGAGVARGYLRRAGLTAERFVPDPFSAEPGARMYRTGDLGRRRADGTLEFVGRTDFQVKVRGFRIEPGEIEARLLEHPGVREAVVLARDDVPGDPRLVAYVVGDDTLDAESLRTHLAGRLPEHMVPAAYVRLGALPLTPSGKLDRRALPAPEGDAYAAREYEAPADETEEALAEIWAEVLRVERVGRHDHFFELGGHSLLAVRVISRVRAELGVNVTLGELFTRPVLKDFAEAILDARLAQFDPDALARLVALAREPADG